jgi:hypothetical protein
MHNLLKYLSSEKDIVEMWKDMEEVGVQHQWLQKRFKATIFFQTHKPICVHIRRKQSHSLIL